MPFLARIRCLSGLCLLMLLPCGVVAQSTYCRDPQFPHRLTMCSPVASQLATRVVTEGLELSFDAPPRETTSLRTPLQAAACDTAVGGSGCPWGVPEGGLIPTDQIEVTGTFLGFFDQRIEIAILQIGANADSGTVGSDVIRVAWSSKFLPFPSDWRAEFTLDASNADLKLPFVFYRTPSSPPDTIVVPGVRITFKSGARVRRGWSAVFDVEDFEGFHIWRWASDPNVEPRVVGTYSKLRDRQRPDNSWPDVEPLARRFTFLDHFVIDGNVYHYAVTTYDQGFDTVRGGSLGAIPFDSPLPDEGCPCQLRVDFLRPPPAEFQPVQAVPNPYRQVDCDQLDPQSTCTVRFIRMPPRGTLLIFTLAGDLVREFHHPADASAGDPPGTLRWDTANGAGREVASGVYIYKIVDLDSGLESFGRVAIIR
ncbi:MAG TPA: hypothetical protein VFE28_04860 [Candidatus Krumholzibacteria bacterium]|nr:hypothetical protein [Candidatus Krumholzibacteria bacterium]